jgi:hypothetical protein
LGVFAQKGNPERFAEDAALSEVGKKQLSELFSNRKTKDGGRPADYDLCVAFTENENHFKFEFPEFLRKISHTVFYSDAFRTVVRADQESFIGEYYKKLEVVWVKTDRPVGMGLTARPDQVIRAMKLQ